MALLLLHNRFDYNTSDIKKAAVKRGWKTERVHDFNIKEKIEGHSYIRYYGNTIQGNKIKSGIPFKFLPLPVTLLFDKLTFRIVNMWRYQDLPQPIDKDMFIKPVQDKWFEARVYKMGETISIEDSIPTTNSLIYSSEVINLVDEVRCFCLNGKILTSSYYRKNTVIDMENFDDKLDDTPLKDYVSELYKKYDLPPGVVLDFGLIEEGKWVFIEANQAWASGIYCCDPDKCLSAIIESQSDEMF